LAFPLIDGCEKDIPGIWLDPLPVVVKALTENKTVESVYENLPDFDEASQWG